MKYGRGKRIYLPGVPHFSALRSGLVLPTPPADCDNTVGMPADLGMMLNGPDPNNPPSAPDGLGCCTIAAAYHACQVWTFNTIPPMNTQPDGHILKGYEEFCGYIYDNPATDQGGVEQQVLSQWVKRGIPWGPHKKPLHHHNKLSAFVEIDVRNATDIMLAIQLCGLVYIGFNVPAYLQGLEAPGSVWDVNPSGDNTIVGGHAIVLPGYKTSSSPALLKGISWGAYYWLTFAFVAQFVDEVYALADKAWFDAKGVTLADQTLPQLEAMMSAIAA